MRKIRKENKKAVSEIVSYVLLIVVAISLSIIVYAWIKIQLPKEIIECPEGVSVIIKDYQCNEQNNIINITFQNKGFFYFTPSLNPGLNLKANFSYGSFNQINKIQITPFVSSKKLGEKKLYVVLCNEKKIVQDIEKCA